MIKRSSTIVLAAVVLGILAIWWLWPKRITLKTIDFAQLPGWTTESLTPAFLAFKQSCTAFLKQPEDKAVGSELIDLKIKDWKPVCLAANEVNEKDSADFFKQWFIPVEIAKKNPVQGLFTGYYIAKLHGALKKSHKYSVPIYGRPTNLVTVDLGLFDDKLKHRRITGQIKHHRLYPFPTREKINQGTIDKSASVLAWVDNRIDRLFLGIQGSGLIELEDGSPLYVGYAAQNGAPYKSVAKVLIDKGVMTRENASMQSIRHYLTAHPDKMDEVLNQNASFVFFRKLKKKVAYGSQGVPLTAGYSLAVDRKYIPLGLPVWLATKEPTVSANTGNPLQRLLIAQDTGGAIKGVVRGDVFWGSGENAAFKAGHMKNKGYYWLLIPKTAFFRNQNVILT